MNWAPTLLVLATAFVAVYLQASFDGVRRILGAQIDLLPALVVYAGLSSGVSTLACLSLCGGLWVDSLSANPLGVSVLPLFIIGLLISATRDLVLRDQNFARWMLGLGASAAVPVLTLLLLLSTGNRPMLGWGTLWQLLIMSLGGAFATPLIFRLLGWCKAALVHSRATETTFRPDREIRRGRV
jgi:cell shape-determining protein MreD